MQGKVGDPAAAKTVIIVDGPCSLQANFKKTNDPWTTVYSEDFAGQVGAEWSSGRTDLTPIGVRRYLGQFGNETATLSLLDLPTHSGLRISLDVFVIRSWDGNGQPDPSGGIGGPDIWSAALRSEPPLLQTTFDNEYLPPLCDNHRQSYPDEYPHGNHVAQTGAAEINTLGYLYARAGSVGNAPADSVYRLQFTVAHSARSLLLDCSASGLETLSNESWGLDNVQIEAAAEAPPAPVPLIAHHPSPANGAAEVVPSLLRWEAGRTAAYHDVYFSASATITARAHIGRQTETVRAVPIALAAGRTYYWRVDEVEGDGTTTHVGEIWSFSTGASVQ